MDHTIDVTVLSIDFNYCSVSGYVDRENSVIGHKAFCRSKLFYDPFAEANVVKEEDTVCIRLSSKHCVLFGKLSVSLSKETKQSTLNRFAVFIYLVALNIAADELVLEGDIDDFAFGLDIHFDRSLVENVTCSRNELTNNPLAKANVFKAEFTFRVRLGYKNCCLFSKLGGTRLKEAELSAGNDVAVFVKLETFNVTTDITVFEFDFHDVAIFLDGDLICLLVKNEAYGRLDLTNHPGTVRNILELKGAVFCAFCYHIRIFASILILIIAEESEYGALDYLAILIDLKTGNRTVLKLVLNGCTIIDCEFNDLYGLVAVSEFKAKLLITQNIMVIGAAFLDIVAAQRQVGGNNSLTVFIKDNDFDKSALRNHRTVSCNNVSLGIETKGDVLEFSIHADAEELVLLKGFLQTHFNFLAFVVEITGSLGNRNLLAGIHELNSLNFSVQYHGVRCCDFLDIIFAQVKFFTGGNSVRPSCDGVNKLALRVMHYAIEGVNVFCSTDLKDRTCKVLHFVYRFVDLIVHYDRLEHLTGLGDMDDTFLRHVGTLYVHDSQTAFVRRIICSNVEVNRVRAQHVSIRRLHLNQIVSLTIT